MELLNPKDLFKDRPAAHTSGDYFAKFLSNGFHLFPQRGKDLGERLSNIFMDKLAGKYDVQI